MLRAHVLILSIMCLAFVNLASGHLSAGSHVIDNGTAIDFGYAPAQPTVQSSANIMLAAVNNATHNPINLSTAWLRISHNDSVVFAGTLQPETGSVSFSYQFPEPGTYTLEWQLSTEEREVAAPTFTLSVTDTKASATQPVARWWIAGILFILALSVGVWRRYRHV